MINATVFGRDFGPTWTAIKPAIKVIDGYFNVADAKNIKLVKEAQKTVYAFLCASVPGLHSQLKGLDHIVNSDSEFVGSLDKTGELNMAILRMFIAVNKRPTKETVLNEMKALKERVDWIMQEEVTGCDVFCGYFCC